MRLEGAEPVPLELLLQGVDALGQDAGLDRDAQLAHAQIEQLFVRPLGPLLGWHHPVLRHPSSLSGAGGCVLQPCFPSRLIPRRVMNALSRLALAVVLSASVAPALAAQQPSTPAKDPQA